MLDLYFWDRLIFTPCSAKSLLFLWGWCLRWLRALAFTFSNINSKSIIATSTNLRVMSRPSLVCVYTPFFVPVARLRCEERYIVPRVLFTIFTSPIIICSSRRIEVGRQLYWTIWRRVFCTIEMKHINRLWIQQSQCLIKRKFTNHEWGNVNTLRLTFPC